jgi:uncharacterized protein
MGQTPPVPPGRRVIDGYGAGGFRIAGETHRGSVLILPGAVRAWDMTDIAALTVESLAPLFEAKPKPEILLVGCGRKTEFIPPALRQAIRERGLVVDAMDTGAACRTYNVLLAEERRVVAALIAVE